MRHLIPPVALVKAIGARSGSSETSTDDSAATTPPHTFAAPTTKTATPTVALTTTRTAPETTETPDHEAAAFEPIPGTPPSVFDAFASPMVALMRLEDTEFEVISAAAAPRMHSSAPRQSTWAPLDSPIGSAHPDKLWLDDRTGFKVWVCLVPLKMRCQDARRHRCSGLALWPMTSDERQATPKISPAAAQSRWTSPSRSTRADGIGVVPDLEDATINSIVMWIDEETNVALGGQADIEVDPAHWATSESDQGPDRRRCPGRGSAGCRSQRFDHLGRTTRNLAPLSPERGPTCGRPSTGGRVGRAGI